MPSSEKVLHDWLASAKDEAEAQLVMDLIAEQEATRAGKSRYTVSTLRDVAAFFGVQEQTVRAWNMRPGGIPGEQGAWPIDEIAKWYVTWKTANTTESEAKPREIIKDQLAALELAERQKRLVDVSEVSTWLGRVANVIRDGLTALENRYGSDAANIMRTPLERLKEEIDGHA